MTSTDVVDRSQRPRILYLQTATNPVMGADAWVLVQLVRHLDRSSHDVQAACHRAIDGVETPVYSQLADLADIEVFHCDLGPELSYASGRQKLLAVVRSAVAFRSIATLAWRTRRSRVQLIHAGDRPRDAFVAVVVARMTGAISIVHVHQVLNPWWTRLLRWSVEHADVVLGVSEFVSASLRDGGVEPSRVRTLPNAIDPEHWKRGGDATRRTVRAELGIGNDAPVVITVCRLMPSKGVAELVRALAAVHRSVSDAVLIVAGTDVTGGAYSDELNELIREHGLGEAVHLLGRRSDVADLMDAADVFAMPSRGEPFGLVYLEAMAKELPVVALRDGGALEIVVDGDTGLLSDPDDGPALADHLVALLTDRERRVEMGRRGRARLESEFTLAQQAAAAAALYRELTG
jgi:glycosyltransferase involved in cell wall biosynthesis